jgi:hypothetical protein
MVLLSLVNSGAANWSCWSQMDMGQLIYHLREKFRGSEMRKIQIVFVNLNIIVYRYFSWEQVCQKCNNENIMP